MIYNINKTMAYILSLSVALAPVTGTSQIKQAGGDVHPSVVNENARPNQLLGSLLTQINKRYDVIFERMDQEVLQKYITRENEAVQQVIKEKVEEIQAGKVNPVDFKQAAIEANLQRVKEQKKELFYQIHNMNSDELDAAAEKIEKNPNYSDFMLRYESAFTKTEKANILASAVYRDLDQLQSMMAKKANGLTKEGWVKDFNRLGNFYNKKAWSRSDWIRALKIAGIVVASAGVLSWGYAELTYGGKYKKEKDKLKDSLDKVRADLEAKYNQLNTDLTNGERNHLNQNGYIRTTCATYEQPDSIICNGHNYQVFRGSKICTVSCYKQASSGKETLHEAPVCTSPFIPANCYDPSEYTRGYNDGYDDYYDDGYDDGAVDGREDGEDDGYDDGYEDGYDSGYEDGYDEGFRDGYASYGSNAAPSVAAKSINSTKTESFSKGYRDGLKDAQTFLRVIGL